MLKKNTYFIIYCMENIKNFNDNVSEMFSAYKSNKKYSFMNKLQQNVNRNRIFIRYGFKNFMQNLSFKATKMCINKQVS